MIKRIYLFTVIIILSVFTGIPCFAENSGFILKSSRFIFKEYMHDLSLNFKHTRRSIGLKKYHIADIHLKHMQEIIKKVPELAPRYNMDGTPLNITDLKGRAKNLEEALTRLREALKRNDSREIEKLPKQVFSICMGCHEEAKLKYHFGLTEMTPTFREYMHSINESYKKTIFFQGKKDLANTDDYLELINYYLSLLEDTFPDEGPSGIIMYRNRLIKTIREAKTFITLSQKDVKEKKSADLDLLKNRLNEVCVACHEPERIE